MAASSRGIEDTLPARDRPTTSTETLYPAVGETTTLADRTTTTFNADDEPRTIIIIQTTINPQGGAQSSSTSATVTTDPTPVEDPSTTSSLINSGNAAEPSVGPASSESLTSPGVSPGAVSSTSSTPTASANDNTPYSTGALAGGIVGALLGAAILTFLATWFLLGRRRKQRPSSSRHDREDAAGSRSARGGALAMAEKPSSRSDRDAPSWIAYLPQSVDDRTMQHKVKSLFDQVELHVDNYYRKANVELDGDILAALARVDSGRLPAPIADLVRNQRMVLSVIKHCIVNLLVTRMTPGKDPSHSLLPSWLAVQPTKLTSSNTPKENSAVEQAYSQWKSLNAWLYGRADDDPSYARHLDAMADEISEILSAAFFPWQASPEDFSAMQQHERNMADTAGDAGTLIMSQPSSYEFRWTADTGESASSRSVIIVPGFWKTSDEKGRPLDQSQLLISPFVVRV